MEIEEGLTASADNTLRDLQMIQKPNSIIVNYYSFKIIPSLNQAKICLPLSMGKVHFR